MKIGGEGYFCMLNATRGGALFKKCSFGGKYCILQYFQCFFLVFDIFCLEKPLYELIFCMQVPLVAQNQLCRMHYHFFHFTAYLQHFCKKYSIGSKSVNSFQNFLKICWDTYFWVINTSKTSFLTKRNFFIPKCSIFAVFYSSTVYDVIGFK